jgi:hypothetical protein
LRLAARSRPGIHGLAAPLWEVVGSAAREAGKGRETVDSDEACVEEWAERTWHAVPFYFSFVFPF